MSQADYYLNGNNSACDTINSPLSTLNSQLLLILNTKNFSIRLNKHTA
ncbi:MAG: hypothetical protein LBE12_12460 [Planctomycetaceae bacterium]|nr:hypothetical protein [Planctomycetaceae bacterium]